MVNESAIMLYLLRSKIPFQKMWLCKQCLQNLGAVHGFSCTTPDLSGSSRVLVTPR